MALFGSSKPTIERSTVSPTIVRTQNIVKEIKKIAIEHNVDVNSLDFNLLKIFTYIRINNDSLDTQWKHITNDELEDLDRVEALLNPHFEIKQTYEIEIFSHKTTHNTFADFKFTIGVNASKCKVYMSISKGSKLEKSMNLNENLVNLVNKKKVRAGILVNIFDEMLHKVILKLSAEIEARGSLVFEKKEILLIAEGIEPIPTQNDELILHYENSNNEIKEHEKIDYASRGFIKSVKKDELLIEYIKPIKGTAGRNCRGESTLPDEPIVAHKIKFRVDETISEEEDSRSVKYIARENGYVAFKDNIYSIKKEMGVNEISFRTTGNILSGIDSNVSLSINETDGDKDAIGSGMKVEVSEIDIDRNIGSNAHVVALKARVGGQTHKTSFIKADELDINIHKGNAQGKEVHIVRLEHGEVEGDNVYITKAIGGIIRAKDIYIEVCDSNIQAIATRYIEIKKLQGSENSFVIDLLLKKNIQKSLNDNRETISELESSLKSINSEIQRLEEHIRRGRPAFLDIKKRLIHYKKNGVKLPTSFVQKYKSFIKLQDDLEERKKEYSTQNDQLLLQTTRTSSLQDDILDARIVNRDKWVGYNEIKFKLIDPPIELIHKPAEGSTEMIFGLVQNTEGEYTIKAMAE